MEHLTGHEDQMDKVIRLSYEWGWERAPELIKSNDIKTFLNLVREEYRRLQKSYPLGQYAVQGVSLAGAVTDSLEQNFSEGNIQITKACAELGISTQLPFQHLNEKYHAYSCLYQFVIQPD